ncbi:C6 transcription factor [Aspergillus brunneoviolaceus CBS 621.78]|uniref:C6 transcription factor n=1 Tax=Aspergillus brunneoviolaceus CBS 621.78 TaxID=1450534 RepID=A0ACD1G3D5_9EURO|nr:C6 transcription factor [Aspergillus brunneoviolaceus CBS 621.78]RAH43718.1 C6 transcription factor [Aspergillus brunneoviolaceus CBS 621.78]
MDKRPMPVDQAIEPTPKRQRLDDAQHKQSQPPEIEIGLGPLIAHNLTDRPCNPDGANLHSSPNSGGDCGSFQSPAAGSWTQDGFSQDPDFLASQEELRCFLFSLANSAVPTRASSPDAAGSGDHLEQLSQPLPKDSRDSWHAPLSEGRHIQYLKNYVTEVAPWLDMFDSQCTFRHQIPALAQEFPALSYAILALSARQIERKNGVRNWYDSLELYQEAIRRLSPLLQVRDTKVVAACVLLCCLEMMSARAQDWRRHLEGCAALFSAFGIHGFSQGVLQAVFWCYARMDLCGALISDGTQTTLLHPCKWLPPGCQDEDAYRLFQSVKSPDMHANYAVYLCMKATQLVSDRTKFVELGEDNGCTTEEFQTRWLLLWNGLQCWLSERPDELLPVQTVSRKPFPHILFVHWAAISSNQLYHTACILLLKVLPKGVRLPRSPALFPLWHARRICGISLANPHQGCLNNSIQPLWIAGQLFSHRSEHKEIINLIRGIEAETGWGTCWRIRDLESAWGCR